MSYILYIIAGRRMPLLSGSYCLRGPLEIQQIQLSRYRYRYKYSFEIEIQIQIQIHYRVENGRTQIRYHCFFKKYQQCNNAHKHLSNTADQIYYSSTDKVATPARTLKAWKNIGAAPLAASLLAIYRLPPLRAFTLNLKSIASSRSIRSCEIPP